MPDGAALAAAEQVAGAGVIEPKFVAVNVQLLAASLVKSWGAYSLAATGLDSTSDITSADCADLR